MIQRRITDRTMRPYLRVCVGLAGLALLAGACTEHRDFSGEAATSVTSTSATDGGSPAQPTVAPGGDPALVTSPPTGETLVPLIPTIDPATGLPVVSADPGAAASDATLTSVASLPPTPASVAGGGQPASGAATPATPTTPAPVVTPSSTAATAAAAGSNCSTKGGTSAARNEGFLSPVVGVDIRVGGHDCFERIVIEFSGEGDFPGYNMYYGSGYSVAGSAVLVVEVGATMSGGTRSLTPSTVEHIRELKLVSNSDGRMTWAIGLDETRKITVQRESSPARLVIDVRIN